MELSGKKLKRALKSSSGKKFIKYEHSFAIFLSDVNEKNIIPFLQKFFTWFESFEVRVPIIIFPGFAVLSKILFNSFESE